VEVEQAFRRTVFNVFAHNRDDHVRNHAFLRQPDGNWRLSPAYDLTYSSGVNGQHNMTVVGSGTPKKSHLLQLAAEAGIGDKKANETIEQVAETVSLWPKFAKQFSLSQDSLKRVGSAVSSA
jgi:serine/threonine-protein kinase HipA